MLRVVELARRSERHASSFRAFVERLNQGAERGEMDEAPIVRFSVHTGGALAPFPGSPFRFRYSAF